MTSSLSLFLFFYLVFSSWDPLQRHCPFRGLSACVVLSHVPSDFPPPHTITGTDDSTRDLKLRLSLLFSQFVWLLWFVWFTCACSFPLAFIHVQYVDGCHNSCLLCGGCFYFSYICYITTHAHAMPMSFDVLDVFLFHLYHVSTTHAHNMLMPFERCVMIVCHVWLFLSSLLHLPCS